MEKGTNGFVPHFDSKTEILIRVAARFFSRGSPPLTSLASAARIVFSNPSNLRCMPRPSLVFSKLPVNLPIGATTGLSASSFKNRGARRHESRREDRLDLATQRDELPGRLVHERNGSGFGAVA